MIDKISTYILDNFLYKNEKIIGEQREIMLFGITRIIEDVPKYIFILLIGIIFNMLPLFAIVFVITLIYKTFVGGAHARTNITCLIFSSVYYIIPSLIARYVNIPNNILYIVEILTFIFSLYIIIKHAPADTEEIPILNKHKKITYKIIAIISLVVMYIVVFLFNSNYEFAKVIILAILLTDIFATNISYKLFKCKHSYESEEFKEYYLQ